jgi:4-diphosphocytidyl-2-C-methyl-D-erythritol kinase
VSDSAVLRAPAKVNLALHVLRRRADGYHELETIFQAVDLCDEVRVSLGGEGVTLEVRGADVGAVEDNLAHRAAVRLRDERLVEDGLQVSLTKRIPVGAGLGGGSSDAAAVLRCAAALVGVPRRDSVLRRIAAELGSDVPFFLGESALALGRGRGEELHAFPPLPPAHLVLVSPPVHVSTAWAYEALSASRERGGEPAGRRLAWLPRGWDDVVAAAHNDFQRLVTARHPEVARSLAALEQAGAEVALMSGSGSTSFGLFPDEGAAGRAAEALFRELGWKCRAVCTLTTLPEPKLV